MFKKKIDQIIDQTDFSAYRARYGHLTSPKKEIPELGMPSKAVYQLIHDELNMDGNPTLNLASFCTTWMEPEADQLMLECKNKNFIDHDEYPQTEVIHGRLVQMLAKMFNVPKENEPVGTATIGSSEAIMLGLLAHKWTWINNRKALDKPYDKPNIVFGADVHVCWEKFARYFDVEARIIPMTKERFVITPEEVEKQVDENTICVGAILGTTFTGQYDPIEKINDLLAKVKKNKGWDIPIHVDGASGGFIAPFVYPNIKWDFRLSHVRSINTSGHKYGLVYPGLGWLIFKDKTDVPEDIVFNVNYLGGEMPTYTLNFSRGSAAVVGQYYNFLRLGKSGYIRIMKAVVENAKYLADKLSASGYFESLNPTQLIPVVAVTLKNNPSFSLFDLTDKLRERGWIIPAYSLPPNAQEVVLMRIVVRETLSRDLIDILYQDIINAYEELEKKPDLKPTIKPSSGHRVC